MRKIFSRDNISNFILAAALFLVMIVTLNIATKPYDKASGHSNVKVVYATETDATEDTSGTLSDDTSVDSEKSGSTENGSTEESTSENDLDSEIKDSVDGGEEETTESNSEGDGSEKESTITEAENAYANSGLSAAELAELTAAYSNTLKEKNELAEKLNELMDSQNDYIERLHELDDMIIEYQGKIEELNTKIGQGTDLLYEMQVSISESEAKEQEQYETVKAHIKDEYENGKYTYLDAFFSAVDYIDIVNKAEYIQSIEAYDKGLLDTYTSEHQKLVDKRALLMAVTSDMDVLQSAYEDEQDTLEILSATKEEQVNSYQSSIDSMKSNIEYLEQKEAEQSAQIAALEQSSNVTFTVSSDSTYTYNGEQFVWPMPTSTTITSYFGYRDIPTAGATAQHNGIDIACNMGSEVKAAAAGVVIYTGYLGSAGNAVILDHGSGITTLYYHLSSFGCSVGDAVEAGETVAFSGSTGVSTGPHLHFGVRENGNYVNPLKYYSTIADQGNSSE
ncbi:MAG: peptidoglycan DD-metalloendopeptidase family protein [Eubacterium sp.]|nr:peptidoglycan DD-metalloendopeptidase family protein [Eubacterium sp.]